MRALSSVAAVVCACALQLDADDWPGLRGPRHDGATAAVAAGERSRLEVAWRAGLGTGYSSVAVAEGRAVTVFSDGRDDVVVALDARTGRELWRSAIAPTLRGRDGSYDGPIATPALAGGRVFGLGPRGHLVALDAASGRELWRVDLVAREGATPPHYGFTSSPIVADGVLVVALGAKPGGALAGFDPATGTLRWRLGDDVVAYQSPIVAGVGGRERVVAASDARLFVVDPSSGRLLLEHAHGGQPSLMAAESLVPVPAGEGRLFLKHRNDESTMLRLAAGEDGGVRVETLWTAPVLRGTYVVPVYHDGFLYGMTGRVALTCVEAATGAVRWRSREPGDGFPIVVGGELGVLTKDGVLHVGPASPDGWSERSRVPLFGAGVWSPPGFADGAFFVRGQEAVARVEWGKTRAAAAAEPAAAPTPRSRRFASFLEAVAAASDKRAVVDAFLAGLPPGPLVEPPDVVVFLYRGDAADVGLGGDMIGCRREDPMWRVPGTDLFWYETRLEPLARVSYHFVRDFDERFPDPRNPWRVPGPGLAWMVGPAPAEQSSVAMPGWPAPDHLVAADPARRGRVEEHVVESRARPGTIRLKVYLPAGYDQGRERLPVALVMDGDAALTQGLVAQSLDHLVASRVAPLIVAFLGRPEWAARPASDDEREAALAELLANDVVAFLDARYRTDPVPERRAVIGAGFAGHAAASVVFRRPRAFGALGLQSVYMLDSDLVGASYELLKKVTPSASDAPLRIYLEWGRYERRGAREPWDLGASNAQLAAFLRERGYQPAGGQAMDASGWAAWRNRTDRVFGTLFPPRLEDASPARATTSP